MLSGINLASPEAKKTILARWSSRSGDPPNNVEGPSGVLIGVPDEASADVRGSNQDPSKGVLVSGSGRGNSELKGFAGDFRSLYCR